MAEVAGPALTSSQQKCEMFEENGNECEPKPKRLKGDTDSSNVPYKLEERLNGILCCAVCLDLPSQGVYQCTNGHLMCASCLSHLLADARLKDETSTCPNCRCEISKTNCIRNLAVEKAISELPTDCGFCSQQLPRANLSLHMKELCPERQVVCKYAMLGCLWEGPFHEQVGHEGMCAHPHKTGHDIMPALVEREQQRENSLTLYKDIFSLLSFEKITFSDLQLRPYRTDDFITKLYYETSRFSAFNLQWVVKAHVNDNQKNPNLTISRELTYQVICKSKMQGSMSLHFVALRGPYGETSVKPAIYQHEFTPEILETAFHPLPLTDYHECNKQLSSKNINIRLILFQVPTK